MRSSVDTLRDDAARLRADDAGRGDGRLTAAPWMALTAEQRLAWAPLRIAVIEAQVAEDEYLNSLLDHALTEEERQRIVDDLWSWEAEASGRDAADMIDFAHESDFSLVKDHEGLLEGRDQEEDVLLRKDGTVGGL